jgi:LysR family transcriptional regulator, glycine cleavage system transcriptional activator
MRLSHLNALRALEAAVRLGSFRAAGDELGVTAAAIGQQVRKLEQALGRTLLRRQANGFEATELASAVAHRLAAGFENLGDALQMMRGGSAAGRLAVSVAPTIAERRLAPRLAGFLARHPEIDLRIDSTHQLLQRDDRNFDFALRYAPPSPNAHAELELFGEWLLPVCLPELAERVQPQDRCSAFRDAPLLHVDKETGDPAWADWDEWGRRFGFAIPSHKHRLRFTRTTLALRSVFDGHGLHLAQLSITLPDLRAGRLVAPFGPGMCVRTGYPYRLVIFRNDAMPPLHAAFTAWIKHEADRTLDAMRSWLEGEPTTARD